MKIVLHMMYKDVRFDIDETLDDATEIPAFIDHLLASGLKPQPVFQKDKPAKLDVVGKMGTIKFIDEGKTKGGKDCFFIRILMDDMPPETGKPDMLEIMQMPITKGKKKVCLWDVDTHVVIIKNDAGFLDLDDATDLTSDMTDEEIAAKKIPF